VGQHRHQAGNQEEANADEDGAEEASVMVSSLLRLDEILETAQRVIDAGLGSGEHALGVGDLFLGAVAGVVQGVGDAVAQAVVETGQSVRGVVVVADPTGVGQGDFLELANFVVVVVVSSVPTCRVLSQPRGV